MSFTEFLGAALRLRGAAASKDLLACFFTSRRLEDDVLREIVHLEKD